MGQGVLVAAYQAAFSAHGLTVGQVLLTADDVTRRTHYRNARRTLERLLELGIVPIVNENDTVATHEIRFGDNDRLAALVAHLVRADVLVLLTDVDALYDGPPVARAARGGCRSCATTDDLDAVTIGGTGSAVGTGGMVTKVEAAGIAGAAGIPTLLTRLADVTGGARRRRRRHGVRARGRHAGVAQALAGARDARRAGGWCSTTARSRR